MIFKYDELKECVKEDFERFHNMGFNEKQIFPAVLNEYEYGENFCHIENICIHIFLILNYLEKNLDFDLIVEKLKRIVNEVSEKEVKSELESEYIKFKKDLNGILNEK